MVYEIGRFVIIMATGMTSLWGAFLVCNWLDRTHRHNLDALPYLTFVALAVGLSMLVAPFM